MSVYKECGCQGRNPNCVRCNGFGMIRPQDKIRPPFVSGALLRKSEASRSKSKKPSRPCPFCKSWSSKMLKHVKKVHPERLSEYENLTKQQKVLAKKVEVACANGKLSEYPKLGRPVKTVNSKTEKECNKENKNIPKSEPLPMFNVGDYVINAKAKNWGVGEIAEIRGDRAEILFFNVGSKTLSLKHASLQLSDKKSISKPSSVPANKKLTYNEFRKNIFKKDNERYLDQYRIVAGYNINLLSKKATFSVMTQKCDKCRKMVASWVFARSNVGRLLICSKCKPQLLDKSFGRLDALDFAQRGGGFEGNRRKH